MAPLFSVGVVTTGASTMPIAFLVTMAWPFSSSRPCVSLNHLYTSSDANSLCGATYKPEQKTPIGFVSAFDRNLIRLAGVQNATTSSKVFLQRSLTILEKNGLQHQEAMQKVASLEVEVAEWRAIA